MVRCEKKNCKKRVSDRDFLYGDFPDAGFVKDPEELFQTPDESIQNQNDIDDKKCCGSDEEAGI